MTHTIKGTTVQKVKNPPFSEKFSKIPAAYSTAVISALGAVL